MCNVLVYLAVDKYGEEWIFSDIPVRNKLDYWGYNGGKFVELPRGTIKKLTGKNITWDNNYIEYVGDNYDPTID